VNLLRNAFESLDSSLAPDRTVTVRASVANPNEVVVSVEDRGIGISPDGLERLFEPFFTTKPDGTGVGLPISRSIVEDHGGRIWAQSNQDRGMTFWFTLPTLNGEQHDGPQAGRLRRGRRSRSARSVATNAGNDGF
jgi:two-component system sensor kinase FixL